MKRKFEEQYEFWCLCVDDDWNPLGYTFLVENAPDDYVYHLRYPVKAAMAPLLDHIAPEQIEFRKVLLPFPCEVEPSEELAAKVKSTSLSDSLDPFSTLSSHWTAPGELLKRHVHIIVRVSEVDVSNDLLKNWNMPMSLEMITDITTLRGYLTSPLPLRKRIPLRTKYWKRLLCDDVTLPQRFCSQEDLATLFTQNDGQTCHYNGQFVCHYDLLFVALILSESYADINDTESSFHSTWDANISNVLQSCLVDALCIRGSFDEDTYTGMNAPDLGLLLKNACIFRGEEMTFPHDASEAREGLISKTRWAYDPAPFVLGYYALGYEVTYCTISYDKDIGKNIIKDIIIVNLRLRRDRIRNAALMIQLVSILRALENLVSEGVDKDLLPPVIKRPDGKLVRILSNSIWKHYAIGSEERVEWLRLVYDALKKGNVPNVDRLKDLEGLSIWLEPVGDDCVPQLEEDVKNAVACVLETLEVIHEMEPPIFHRDIRWGNVIRNKEDKDKWILIDWEDSAMPPTKAVVNMDRDTHPPQMFEDGHGAEVDLWGVGRLVLTALPPLSPGLLLLAERMMNGTIKSAAQGLSELKNI